MSWQEEFRDSLKSTTDLKNFFGVDFPETNFPLFLPKRIAEKIKILGMDSALAKQFLPNAEENIPSGRYDPIGDKVHAKGNQIIHRYENRVLFTPTTVCPVLCRYCFRKNELAQKDELFDQNFNETLNYLKAHREINEVIFTGGDPLVLSNEKLASYIQDLSEIDSLKYLRFHSRTPVILPSRIDEGFIELMISARHFFKRVMLMVHINHLDEVDGEFVQAVEKLNEAGVELYAQTVLLKGVNDNTETLFDLFSFLNDFKIKPYYLHHPDETLGAMHFTLSLEEGRHIYQPLRNRLSGWALPEYVIDIPGGEGKIGAMNPENYTFSGFLINRHGLQIKID